MSEPAVRQPYRLWSMLCPFTKEEVPVVGNFGRTARSVVIMTSETFKRLVADHPELATAQFEVGEFIDEGA